VAQALHTLVAVAVAQTMAAQVALEGAAAAVKDKHQQPQTELRVLLTQVAVVAEAAVIVVLLLEYQKLAALALSSFLTSCPKAKSLNFCLRPPG
jgi:hypothetical protein